MIEARGLTKRFGDTLAVSDLSFTVQPGVVTGFLGPNGAGKSTTMRMILGLDTPTAGSATVDGQRYAELHRPLTRVGALLDAKAIHGGRSAYHHLQAVAQSNGIPRSRVRAVLDQVGLESVARKRSKGFSLGMGQRLGIATALLGDPATLILDEPVNGLDPEGILWIRNLLKHLASQGRTVLVSSHLMSEMAVTAEHLVVIGRGRLIADTSTAEFIQRSTSNHVRVRSPQRDALVEALRSAGGTAEPDGADAVSVAGMDIEAIGELAAKRRFVLHELSPQQASLEAAFMELTGETVEYHAGTTGSPAAAESAWGAGHVGGPEQR
jgi:ABC-2 type transport system ATP-binding protein